MKYLRYIKDLLIRFGRLIGKLFIWCVSWFENHQTLRVRQNQYNSEGEVIDVIVHTFEVRKFYKCTAKHMRFKTMAGSKVELKTATPMDYMTETIE